MRLKDNRWFFMHLISYMLILLVPLIIINGVYGKQVNKAYQKEILESLDSDVQIMRNDLDSEIQLMSSTVSQLYMLKTLRNYRFETDPIYANTIKAMLSTFTVTNPLVQDIVYLPYGQEYVFSSSSTSKVDFFPKEVLVSKTFSPEEFLNELTSLTHIKAFPTNLYKKESGLSIAIPMLSDYAKVVGVCIFFISDSALNAKINMQLEQYHASLVIKDSGDTILFQTGEAFESKIPDLYENPLVFSTSSTILPWSYTVQVPQEQKLLSEMNSLNQMMQTSTIIVVVAVAILISMLMVVNYSPIRKLQKLASTLTPSLKDKTGGEIQGIAKSLDYLKNQNLTLVSKLEESKNSTKNLVLQRLLSGKYPSFEDFNEEAGVLNLLLPHPCYSVACIMVQESHQDVEKIASMMSASLPEELCSYYVFTPIPDTIYFINSLAKEQEKNVYCWFETMRQTIEAETSLVLTIGLGAVEYETTDIPKSFLQARTALDYRFIRGKNTTISFEEVSRSVVSYTPYPSQELERLKHGILTENERAIHKETSNLVQIIEQGNIPLFIAKVLCFDILKLFIENQPFLHQSHLDSQKELFLLSDIETVEEVVQIIESVKAKLFEEARIDGSQSSEMRIQDILDYIKLHCFECSFSMLEVADHFGMQLSNLSLFFKEQMGMNLLDYSTNLRMEVVKQLLISTDLPMKDLSIQVGYYNVSSFIRRFKQIHGITPGDYRRIYQQQLDR